jgi:hypothetical protein
MVLETNVRELLNLLKPAPFQAFSVCGQLFFSLWFIVAFRLAQVFGRSVSLRNM